MADDWVIVPPAAPAPTAAAASVAPSDWTVVPPGGGANTPVTGDKYQQAAAAELAALDKTNSAPSTGYGARAMRGATLGWNDELRAAISTPLEMYRHGVGSPIEGYRYAKAVEDALARRTDENTAGVGGTLAEIGGGLVTGAGAFGGAARPTVATVGQALPRIMGTGAALGGVAGAGNAQTLADVPTEAGKGAAMGGLLSGALGVPGATGPGRIPFTHAAVPETLVNVGRRGLQGGVVGGTLNAARSDTPDDIPGNFAAGAAGGAILGGALPLIGPVMSQTARTLQMPRLRDPEVIATRELADVARRARMSPQEAADEVARAHAAGQGEYTLADALGIEGQRKLAAMRKTPGSQRDIITDYLTQRNLDMRPNVGARVGEALGAPQSALQAEEALLGQAQAQAAPLYRQAMQVPVTSPQLREMLDLPVMRAGLRAGLEQQEMSTAGTAQPFLPIHAAVVGYDNAGMPIIRGVPNMTTLHTAKVGLDNMIDSAVNPATGRPNIQGRALMALRSNFLNQIDQMNPAYAAARRAYAGPMQVRDAVDTGVDMARRGRPGDTVPAFQAMPQAQQQGARIGYADAIRDPLERGGNYPNILKQKSQKGVDELNALSLHHGPYQPGRTDPLREYLNRVETMGETSKAALGGSPTAENLADMADTTGTMQALGLAGHAVTGNLPAAIRSGLGLAQAIGRGENEAQRVAITRMLLANDPAAARAVAARINAHNARYNAPPPARPWSQFFQP